MMLLNAHSDTAYCLNPYKRKFYCFDDQEVHDVEPNAIQVLHVCSVGTLFRDLSPSLSPTLSPHPLPSLTEFGCISAVLHNCGVHPAPFAAMTEIF